MAVRYPTGLNQTLHNVCMLIMPMFNDRCVLYLRHLYQITDTPDYIIITMESTHYFIKFESHNLLNINTFSSSFFFSNTLN